MDLENNEIVNVRLENSASAPASCTSSVYGMIWHDTDTGINYVCDASRDKWLSLETMHQSGAESGGCIAGADNANHLCAFDIATTGLVDGLRAFYIPYNFTVIASGFSQNNDDCVTGNFSIELWGSASNTTESATEKFNLTSGITTELSNANNLDVDFSGPAYFTHGINNNCGETIDQFLGDFYYKWRHD